ncbi:MAG: CoB--CoM heterodisulfide reductase iron-sulfur subunit B family protein [Candidatus Hodarchaeota archaeon]
MSKYAFFLGCTIPYRLPFAEAALRQTLPEFGVELADLPFGCCPDPGGVQSFNAEAWHTLAARNLCVAEEENLDILAACTGCFETLKVTNAKLKADPDLRVKINENLKEVDREFKGTIEVKHFAQVFHNDIGSDAIAAKVTKPLKDFKFATHSGCHYAKPAEYMQTDNPENPTHLDNLIEALGAESVPYLRKNICCGAGVRGVDQPVAYSVAREKIVEIERVGADALVTICPTCFVSYDIGQVLMAKQFGKKTKIPVFIYPELLGIAMGLDLSEGFKMHTIKVKSFLQKFNGEG